MIHNPDDFRVIQRGYADGGYDYVVQFNKHIGTGKYWTDVSSTFITKTGAIDFMKSMIVVSETPLT